jgi:hypothetical protein
MDQPHAEQTPPPEAVNSLLLAAPADAPRDVTAWVRRRTWTEPRVRLWWMMALGVLLLTLYIVITQAAAWWSERRLLTHGVAVQAVIVRAQDRLNDITVPDKQMPPDSVCTLKFTLNGQEYEVRDQLKEHMERGQHVVTGPDHPITLHVDSEDPQRWTDRTSAPPLLSRQLVGVTVGLPVVVVLISLALMKRRGLLEVWRSGPASTAMVLEMGQTPVAPGARSLRCTAADHGDKRVFTVYVPASVGTIAPGDVLWVIRPNGKADTAYAAVWFGERSGKTA